MGAGTWFSRNLIKSPGAIQTSGQKEEKRSFIVERYIPKKTAMVFACKNTDTWRKGETTTSDRFYTDCGYPQLL